MACVSKAKLKTGEKASKLPLILTFMWLLVHGIKKAPTLQQGLVLWLFAGYLFL
jgi:hypothetical protein